VYRENSKMANLRRGLSQDDQKIVDRLGTRIHIFYFYVSPSADVNWKKNMKRWTRKKGKERKEK
jgi:hypothetical protein